MMSDRMIDVQSRTVKTAALENPTTNRLFLRGASLLTNIEGHTSSTSDRKFRLNRPQTPLSLIINHHEAEVSPKGSSPEYSSGGFHLTSMGIEGIPETSAYYGPTTPKFISHSEIKNNCGNLRSFIASHPRYSQEAIVGISQIGEGTSCTVRKCIYVPTLSLIALKIMKVSSPAIAKQIEMELKTLYSLKSKVRNSSKSEDGSPLIDDADAGCIGGESPVAKEEREHRYSKRQAENQADIFDIAQIEKDMNADDANMMNSPNIRDRQKFLSAKWDNPPRPVAGDSPVNGSVESPVRTGCSHRSPIDENCQSSVKDPVPFEFPTPPSSTGDQKSFSPYIVNLLDAFVSTDEMSVCLVLEYMGGGSLKKFLANKIAVKEKDIAIVAYSVLKALEELHNKNIIHRDVHPSNILIHSDGAVKLSDFGISRETASTDAESMTFTGRICYMSPERIRGEKYGKSSDIWALGITILFCITGKSQFPDEKGYWNILDSIERNVPSVDSRGTSGCTEELNDFISSCLVNDRKKRATATQLLQSDFIHKAIGRGFITSPLQPKLSGGIHSNPAPLGLVKSIVNTILDWRPEHMKEMVLLESPHTPDASPTADPSDGHSGNTEPWKFTTGRPTATSDKPLYSKEAILQLSSALRANPEEVMQIIINRHTNIKEIERSRSGEKDLVPKILSNLFNPLYHYSI